MISSGQINFPCLFNRLLLELTASLAWLVLYELQFGTIFTNYVVNDSLLSSGTYVGLYLLEVSYFHKFEMNGLLVRTMCVIFLQFLSFKSVNYQCCNKLNCTAIKLYAHISSNLSSLNS